MSRLLSVSTAFALAVSATAASAQTELRYKFSPGESATYVVTTTSESQLPAGGMQVTSTTTQTITSERKVAEVKDDGSADLVDKTNRLEMKTDIKGLPQPMSMEWDSDSGEAPTGPMAAAAPVLTALVGSETKYTMSPRGDVTDVTYEDELKEAVKTMPNGEAMLEQFTVNAIPLPEEPVKVGDSWPYETSTAAQTGKMTMSGTQTLKSLDGDIAVFEGEFTVAVDGELMPGMKAEVKESAGKMTTRFNVAKGYVEKTTTTLDFTMAMEFGGQKMENTAKTKTEVVRKDSASE